jgi:WD40 repeat protein/transcriptional regulator with XRE-family HTH domain
MFRSLLLRDRGRTGLTQRGLAARAGASARSLQDWEAGVTLPTAERLQGLIGALLEARGLTPGHERSDARELWLAVQRETPRMHAAFDDTWFDNLLDRVRTLLSDRAHDDPQVAPPERVTDWGEAPDNGSFVGRSDELAQLREWVLNANSRLIAVLGIGGIGKTTLAAKVAQEAAPNFDRIYWRSMRNAPPVSDWLAAVIGFVSDHHAEVEPSESARISTLLELLRTKRCLLVLDNAETLFETGQSEGRYRAGMEGYGRLLQAVGVASHRSCVLITSRECPPELAVLDRVRSIELHGLSTSEVQVLLADKQLIGDADTWAKLVHRYGGNGLALKIVSETIRQIYNGAVVTFLEGAIATYGTVFGGIRRLLDVQFERLSSIERDVLTRMAVEREPVSLVELSSAMRPSVGRGSLVEAIENLRRRSLVDRGDRAASFTLQSMVLEYMTDRLVETVVDEIEDGRATVLCEQPLIRAQATDYVRQTQERLIGTPILTQLSARHGKDGAAQRLLHLLDSCRGRPPAEQGNTPGNLVNLLRLLRSDLRSLDLSRLVVRQAYLAQVDAQDAKLVDAELGETVLAEAFDFPSSVALSADGALLATGTSNGQVWVWRVADRTSLWMVQGHTGGAWGLALSTGSRLLASGGAEGAVRLWELDTGRPLGTVHGGTATVHSLALSADGQLLASASGDGTVRLWSLEDVPERRAANFGLPEGLSSGRLLISLQDYGEVYGVALSADGELLATSGFDGMIRLWEARTGRPLATLPGHTGAVRAVALSSDGDLVAGGGTDGTVRLWSRVRGANRDRHATISGIQGDLPVFEPVATIQGHGGGVLAVAVSADGRLVASGGLEGTVQVRDARTQQPVAMPQSHTGTVRGVALSADGQLLASAGFDGTIKLCEATNGRPLATLQGHTGAVYSVALTAGGEVAISGGFDGIVQLWNVTTGEALATLRGHSSPVRSVAMSANGSLAVTGGSDGTLRLWATNTGRPAATLQGHAGGVWAVALSADGRVLASAGGEGTVRLWEFTTGRPLATLQGFTGNQALAFSADGRVLACGGVDGRLRLWQADTGQPMATMQGHSGGVLGLALSADGRLLASGGGDGLLRLWTTDTGALVANLVGRAGGVLGVALSADAAFVADVSADGTLSLWQTDKGQIVTTMRGHSGLVRAVALSADGQVVASGGFDGTVRLWQATTGTCLRILRAERRYERLDITGLTGVTTAQRAALLALGAIDRSA